MLPAAPPATLVTAPTNEAQVMTPLPPTAPSVREGTDGSTFMTVPLIVLVHWREAGDAPVENVRYLSPTELLVVIVTWVAEDALPLSAPLNEAQVIRPSPPTAPIVREGIDGSTFMALPLVMFAYCKPVMNVEPMVGESPDVANNRYFVPLVSLLDTKAWVASVARPVRGPTKPEAVNVPVFALNVNDDALFNVDTVPLVVGENRTR